MQRALTTLLVLALTVPVAAGCIIDNRPRHRTVVRESGRPSCGPAYHWDGVRCVHNGKAKGHYK